MPGANLGPKALRVARLGVNLLYTRRKSRRIHWSACLVDRTRPPNGSSCVIMQTHNVQPWAQALPSQAVQSEHPHDSNTQSCPRYTTAFGINYPAPQATDPSCPEPVSERTSVKDAVERGNHRHSEENINQGKQTEKSEERQSSPFLTGGE